MVVRRGKVLAIEISRLLPSNVLECLIHPTYLMTVQRNVVDPDFLVFVRYARVCREEIMVKHAHIVASEGTRSVGQSNEWTGTRHLGHDTTTSRITEDPGISTNSCRISQF